MEPLIQCNALYFSYETLDVLDDVNLTIFPKDYVILFGPNGGGKTTLLKLLLGFLKPTKGSLNTTLSTEHLAPIAYVPQQFHQDRRFPISVLDLVLMGKLSTLPWYGRYSKEDKEKALEALSDVQMECHAKKPFGALSGGEARRVLIARALVSNPELLILDEPTSHLDIKTQEIVYTLLKRLKTRITLILVTHQLGEILPLGDRFFCVHKTVSSMQPEEVCEHFSLGLYPRT